MSKSKWEKFQENHQQNDNETKYITYFKNNLIPFLRGDIPANNEANTPQEIIKKALLYSAELTRIFDAFPFPAPTYEEMLQIMETPNGLREHIKANLDKILPILLNKEGTALNPLVVDAIRHNPLVMAEVKDEDNAFNNLFSLEEEVAKNFMKSIIVSYGQRVLDNISDSDQKIEAFNSVMSSIESLAKEVTLKGIPKEAKTISSEKLGNDLAELAELLNKLDDVEKSTLDRVRNIVGAAQDCLAMYNEEQNNALLDKADERYQDAVNKLIEVLPARKPKDDLKDELPARKTKENDLKVVNTLSNILNEFKVLIDEPEAKNLGLAQFTPKIETAQAFLNLHKNTNHPMFLTHAIDNYHATVNQITELTTPKKPEEINWFVKFLRWCTRNNELLQNKEEKRYNQQTKLNSEISRVIKNELLQLKEELKENNGATQEIKEEQELSSSFQPIY
ncbi:hypothetical protein Lgra_0589 [Legionella gratiana]|uniref:Uncharacterized protein n=1 Tax=Legionella gratiana TaxID=45066 RepID=A0A378J284_9GAMM|nr:hypothetical protein [Legionella gratiana]KTD14558.1 hypothetical protein Lgra_0589 [Legionella gratiana]STX41854.1 Uncharacterised protein [Legionella gratiana]